MAPDSTRWVSPILNACWVVRHLQRGGRVNIQREQRQEAIRQLGLVVREALIHADEHHFEPILAALIDGLRPKDVPPF